MYDIIREGDKFPIGTRIKTGTLTISYVIILNKKGK